MTTFAERFVKEQWSRDAAPELLEALEAIMKQLKLGKSPGLTLRQQARAAIAKAKGE